ncbi:MAG: bifunctional hydroxymethylpyrimidine kinase/phosphomethylpyrimidine kinase [Nitrosopumilaceae archaeon]
MNLLSIAGSDPSSGAGIQSDVKTFTSLGAYALTVITSITSQNTTKFATVEPVSPKMIKSQIDSVFSDFKIDAIKIGMVYNSTTIKAISSKLSHNKIPIILDPVIKSTTGGILLKRDAFNDYLKFLLPLSFAITPNLLEASILSGIKIKNKKDLYKSALKIKELGANKVIITGVNFEKNTISDFIVDEGKMYSLSGKKIQQINHGSGCNFSAALTVAIGKGNSFNDAVKFARKFTFDSIKNSKNIGRGIRITDSTSNSDGNKKILEYAINDLKKIKKIYTIIPECQTNFVYSKKKIKSTKDVLGISGRIVKTGKNIEVAGSLKYGGSKHVATALYEINKKFPDVRSAINIKYNPKLIKNCQKKSLVIQSYDRKKEPKEKKRKENLSISWGIKEAIKISKKPPDIIYHKGDFGKEPMIMIFGNNPKNVVDKVTKILRV